MSVIRNFRELDVHRNAMELTMQVFELTKKFPPEERFNLIDQIRRSKPNLSIVGGRQTIQVDGERALSTRMSSDSPLGGRETDWLVTIPDPEGLIYIMFNAPDWDFQKHESFNFRPMLDSVRLRR